MNLNYLAILLAVIAEFAAGFVWYGPLFGKLWGHIHGFDKLSKAEQDKLMKEMGPIYGFQLLVTILTTFVLAIFITNLPGWNVYAMTGFFWIGFTVPAQVSAVLFSNTPKKWMFQKVLLQAGGSLVALEIATAIIYWMR